MKQFDIQTSAASVPESLTTQSGQNANRGSVMSMGWPGDILKMKLRLILILKELDSKEADHE